MPDDLSPVGYLGMVLILDIADNDQRDNCLQISNHMSTEIKLT